MLTNPRNKSTHWFVDIITLTFFLSIFYAMYLGSHALFTPDEGRYSEVAREMVATGDYITPRLNGVVFLDKPILYYWLQASAIKLFGVKEWALRLWPALFGIFACLMTYLTGRIIFNRRTGILAALILATSPLYYGGAHYANLDLEVATLVANSLLCFLAAWQVSSRWRSFLLLCAYVFASLAVLTKGLIGIVFPILIIGMWIVLLNRWSLLSRMHLFFGLVIFLCLVLPWYCLVQKANPEFFNYFFVKQQVSRFLTTAEFNNRTPAWFYVPIVIAGLFPWSLFLLQSIYQKICLVWQDKQKHANELFLLLWLGIIFTFFSLPKSKTVGYILPIFPVLALLIADYWDRAWDKIKPLGIYVASLIFPLAVVLIGITTFVIYRLGLLEIPHALITYLNLSLLNLLVFSIVIYVLLRKHVSKIFTSYLLCSVIFLVIFSASASVLNQKSIKPLAMEIEKIIQPNDQVVSYYRCFQDLPIYLQRRIIIVADWNAPDIESHDNWMRELWYGMPFQDTKKWLIDKKTFWQYWNSNTRLYVLLDTNEYNQLKNSNTYKMYKIMQYNDVVLMSNQPVAVG